MSSDMESIPSSWVNMSEEDRYRRHAKFCREQASIMSGLEAERWRQMAEEYERLAEGQRAPYNQQQSKSDK